MVVSLNSRLESNKEEEKRLRLDRSWSRMSQPPVTPPSSASSRSTASTCRFRGGLVYKAHRLLYHSTLGLRVITKKKKSTCRKKGLKNVSGIARVTSLTMHLAMTL